MNRAVFFDIDGIIRHNNTSKKNGCYYCLSYDQVDYINGIFKAHKYLQDAGYKIFWVTMQNCIKEGLIQHYEVHKILMQMGKDFENGSIIVANYHICTSDDESDESKVIAKYKGIESLSYNNDIDLSKSIGIGDRKHDIDAYKMAGIGITIQALNLHGDREYPEADYHYIQNDFLANLESLEELLLRIHGCNDIPHLVRIAENFHHVEKVWGDEYWITNDEQYCSKILILNPNHISSLHYHIEKCETFTVLAGVVKVTHNDKVTSYIRGESVLIPSEDEHRFEAVSSPAVILETSTHHDDDDTYRLEESK